MSFKIVQTIEDGQNCLSIVPGLWEDNGILYWPKSKALLFRMQKQAYSLPNKQKWDKLICIKKRDCATYQDAEKELLIMEGMDDTDLETMDENDNKKSKNIRTKNNVMPVAEIPDFNYMIPPNNVKVRNNN